MIDARGLVLGYEGRIVLRDVELMLRPHELVAIVGPNGSGKSTLLRALAGSLVPMPAAWRSSRPKNMPTAT
jgi:ABC-type cobalamin/Fe3+-siderophores transport system ATPase subunit